MFDLRTAAAVLIGGFVATAPAVAAESLPRPPLEQNGGTWDSGHVQGIAVDVRGGYIYYSFTNLLAKYDANKPFAPLTAEDIR